MLKINVGSCDCVRIQSIFHKNKRIYALEMGQKPISESESMIFYEKEI